CLGQAPRGCSSASPACPPALSSSHSWTQAWEKLKIGLTMNICSSGAVRHYLCKALLGPPPSLT
ncbi:unnamed protein product, partial [Coccothraustes coccothraustes]